jgi:RimJ/RimL family protein N-acetyltransferase
MAHLFDFDKNYILEDDCVLLRPLTTDDCSNLLYFSLHEPTTWQYGLVTAAGEENLKKYISDAVAARAAKKEYAFIVYDKLKQAYAGSTRFYDINLPFNTLQLGYTWYGEAFRGTGLNKHCKFLLLQFAFEQMNFLRVEFRADANNARSIAAMKSIGCKEEGILRSHMPTQTGGRRSSVVLSILQNEWEESVKENLFAKLQ